MHTATTARLAVPSEIGEWRIGGARRERPLAEGLNESVAGRFGYNRLNERIPKRNLNIKRLVSTLYRWTPKRFAKATLGGATRKPRDHRVHHAPSMAHSPTSRSSAKFRSIRDSRKCAAESSDSCHEIAFAEAIRRLRVRCNGVELAVFSSSEHGTVDWKMSFRDGSASWAGRASYP